jgi:hypothetical protein
MHACLGSAEYASHTVLFSVGLGLINPWEVRAARQLFHLAITSATNYCHPQQGLRKRNGFSAAF